MSPSSRGAAGVAVLALAMSAGAMLLTAQAQDRPGIMTRAQVWIQNRGGGEAIPVTLERANLDAPLGTAIVGTPVVALAPGANLLARAGRQSWEYRALVVGPGEDLVQALNQAGKEGWETTGLQRIEGPDVTLVLKRPAEVATVSQR